MAEAESKSRPILFSAPMVKALLAGTKTQTRRIMKPQPELQMNGFYHLHNRHGGLVNVAEEDIGAEALDYVRWAKGDTLWVKETWRTDNSWDKKPPSAISAACLDAGYSRPWAPLQYEADLAQVNWDHFYTPGKVRVSIHMPRWASRISLLVTHVRVERLQSIGEEDAKAEGVTRIGAEFIAKGFTSFDDGPNFYCVETGLGALNSPTAAGAYKMLWEHINGAGSWDANPWVVAITFERLPDTRGRQG